MNKPALGTLTQVDLRTYWKDEAKDFTPWLAQEANIALLANAIGMELEVTAVERNVGPYFADILCKDVASEKWVVIENQLEKTDHSHLGQVLTYAAGLDAETVIWVAPKFTAEHRAALDWLNEITSEQFSFFGVEIELWRIGDSVPAPKFNLVCHPNDWSRAVQASAARRELSANQKLQLEFWTGFHAFMAEKSTIRCAKPQPQQWMGHRIGLRGCHLDSVISTYDSTTGKAGGEIRVDVYLDGADSKQLFAQLQQQRSAIESELGDGLTWYSPEQTRMSRIYMRRPVEVADKGKWPDYYDWLKAKLEAAERVFAPRIRSLSR